MMDIQGDRSLGLGSASELNGQSHLAEPLADVARLDADDKQGRPASLPQPDHDLLITEYSFFHMIIQHLASTFGENESRAYSLEEFIEHHNMQGMSLETKSELWGAFLKHIGLKQELNRGYAAFTHRDLAFFEFLHSTVYMMHTPHFRPEALELFRVCAENVIAERKATPSISDHTLRIRPLERVCARVAEWLERSPVRNELSHNGILEFAVEFVGKGGPEVNRAVSRAMIQELSQRAEAWHRNLTGVPLSPRNTCATYLAATSYRRGRKATDNECRLLLLLPHTS